ncbi:MAG: SAM-dependent chlorinase/fluorinase [Bacteroidales bacterium]|nr:SAM-dependent chlorinase/fluorinase [Bacteroidales bacterium]MBN2755650.1 SAM-dependent chlorinase/fluorinase [Bacteroidales bacterium]
MSVISLISDWNFADYYIGAVKGYILSNCPDAKIIDINNQISNYNISQTAFVLENTYKNFPEGTVHIVAVNSNYSEKNPHVIIKHDNHFFIGTDNGIFNLFIKEKPEIIIEIENNYKDSSFPELDVFAPIACKLINNEPIESLGKIINELHKQIPILPAIEDSLIIGKVIYIDSYGNIITNVTKDLFEKVGKNRGFNIFVQSKSNKISKISKTYTQTAQGELLALFNSANYLEIAIRNGNAAELFRLTTNSSIRIVYNDNKNSENDIQGRLF